jgi:NAD(P)-dependent dehydrogenase (short-subunit alcohol dehydrogenase family)
MTDPSLAGKVTIVTGGGRGLGRAMAIGLARAGAHVIVTAARGSTEIEELANSSDGMIFPIVADVTKETDCRRVVAEAVDKFGKLDVLVNNAGRGMKFVSESFMTAPTKFWEVAPETWRMIIDTNVNGPFLMSREAVPHMLANKWGRIINISMNSATITRKGFSPYGPSKAALESETKIWAQDLEGSGITVNMLLPGGAVETGMIPPEVSDNVRKAFLRPEVIVSPVLWLASEQADGVTGQRIIATEWSPELAEKLVAEKGRGKPQ